MIEPKELTKIKDAISKLSEKIDAAESDHGKIVDLIHDMIHELKIKTIQSPEKQLENTKRLLDALTKHDSNFSAKAHMIMENIKDQGHKNHIRWLWISVIGLSAPREGSLW